MENQNQYNPNQPHQGGFYQMPPVPNATTILVLGILSIVFCWTYGVVGLILGIVALALSGKSSKTYLDNPSQYSVTSYNNLKAGRICAIIGTILSALFLIYLIVVIAFVGAIFTSLPWEQFGR